MSILLEDSLPVVKHNGLNTDKAVVLGSTLAATGAITATGGVVGAVTGNVQGDVTGNAVQAGAMRKVPPQVSHITLWFGVTHISIVRDE